MISKTGVHALLAVVALGRLQRDQYAGAADIARGIRAPRNYLGKLLKKLADEGLLESQKGKGGGFRLRRDPSRIALLDAIDPIESVSRWSGCFLGQGRCSDSQPCAVHERWKKVRDTYLAFLEETTIADLLQESDLKEVLTRGRRSGRGR
jgi:Rrf2 family protein